MIEFPYTDMSDVDSSLATGIFYNSETHDLAIQMLTQYGPIPSVIYEQVPYSTFAALVDSRSVGKTYNQFVKNSYKNKFGKTVYEVRYTNVEELVDNDPNELIVSSVDNSGDLSKLTHVLKDKKVKEVVIRFV